MSYPDGIMKKMVSLGTLGYSLRKVCNVLDLDAEQEAQLVIDFDDPDSEIYKAYQKGKDKADFAIDVKLFEAAKDGNLQALREYEMRKQKEQDLESLRRARARIKKHPDD